MWGLGTCSPLMAFGNDVKADDLGPWWTSTSRTPSPGNARGDTRNPPAPNRPLPITIDHAVPSCTSFAAFT